MGLEALQDIIRYPIYIVSNARDIELSIEAFVKRVGTDYPLPRVKDGRRQLWLRDDLDKEILPRELVPITDIAEDL